MMKFRNGKLFGGVYCADNLPKKPKVNYGYIVNTDNCASSGTHWVAFYFPSNQMPEYFDSNGFPPMNFRFLDFLGYQKHFFFSNLALQSSESFYCGFFCIYYLCERMKGKDPISVINAFDQLNKKNNDFFLENYIRKTFRVDINNYYDHEYINKQEDEEKIYKS